MRPELEGSFLLAQRGLPDRLAVPRNERPPGRGPHAADPGRGSAGEERGVCGPLPKLPVPVHASALPPPEPRAGWAEPGGPRSSDKGLSGRRAGCEGRSGRAPGFSVSPAGTALWAPPGLSGPLWVAHQGSARVRSARSLGLLGLRAPGTSAALPALPSPGPTPGFSPQEDGEGERGPGAMPGPRRSGLEHNGGQVGSKQALELRSRATCRSLAT